MKINITTKAQYSIKRLEEFNKLIEKSIELKSQDSFCIYATGSYGRLEASKHSDLDLFFLSNQENGKFSKIAKALIDSDIIKASRKMKLPEFSGDGAYLEIHNLKDIYSELGSRKDDYNNFFTARMLLLLESRAVYNNDGYEAMLKTTIDKYYKDFHEHEKSFKPVFLVNDVIRFWRTMCLNYEHNRHRKFEDKKMSKEEVAEKKNEAHIKNLKLKFSRKLTCYSFLLSVLYANKVLKQGDILEIIKQTPLQRLESLKIANPHIAKDISNLISLYFWFLERTQKEKSQLIDWINNSVNRDDAFNKSREFSKLIFKLMIDIGSDNENLMYFLV